MVLLNAVFLKLTCCGVAGSVFTAVHCVKLKKRDYNRKKDHQRRLLIQKDLWRAKGALPNLLYYLVMVPGPSPAAFVFTDVGYMYCQTNIFSQLFGGVWNSRMQSVGVDMNAKK